MAGAKHPAPGLRPRRYANLGALTLLVALTLFAARGLVLGGTAIGMDAATQFYPWYSYLGESLRSGQIPAWNPHQFSGVPFAGDPLSGWTYLPAMLLFTLLPLALAAKTYILLHLLLAGFFAYGLARVLGMNVAGALLTGVAYEYASYFYVRNTCCFAYASVFVWLPLAILGAELAIRSDRWLNRGLWWGVSGLAVSQILASWLGQGSYYALLALGGYVAYRTLLVPPDNIRGVWGRVSGAVLHGVGVLLFGFGLAAAGLLPRLEYNALSNLAGGYSGESITGGWTIADWDRLLLSPSLFYAGAGVLALALVAPFLSRRGLYAVPYSAGLALFALTFAGTGTTLLHSALYLLPYLDRLHPHNPHRVMVIFFLATALLAGATLTHLTRGEGRRLAAISLPILAAIFLVTRSTLEPPVEIPETPPDAGLWSASANYLLRIGVQMPPGAFWALALVAVLAVACAILPSRPAFLRGMAAVLMALVVFVDLYSADQAYLEVAKNLNGGDKIVKTDLAEFYETTGATRFLQSREGVSRYLGYEPRFTPDGRVVPYQIRFTDPATRALEAANRATLRGGNMYAIQGYNAIQLERYGEYMDALNGRSQDYHDADVFPGGLDSPLLDLLGTRYIVVPSNTGPEDQKSLRELERKLPTVYEDGTVKILENQEAMPRAWIVHSARQAAGEKALDLLSSGEVDPTKTALVEGRPPLLEKSPTSARDRVSIEGYEANKIRIETETDADSLLVLGDVYYPAWKAYVDGEPVPLYRADYLFRAVPIPAGQRTIELRYESWPLRIGVAVSGATSLAFAALILLRVRKRNRNKPNAVY
ncbi:MAG: YfhO family protein [Rubrobacteraceae bacterium]